MDSSYYNPSYGQRCTAFSPRPRPRPSPQSYPENPNFYGGSDRGAYHHNHHHHPTRHELPPPPPPPPVVNQPPSYYSPQPPPSLPQQHHGYNPQQFTYDSPRMSQPSSSFSCTDARDISQAAWVGYKETRPDSWVGGAGSGRNYQVDYGRVSRDCSGDNITHGLDSNSRFRDEFRSLGYVRKEFGTARIEENYQNRGQFRLDSDRSSRVLGAGDRGLSSTFGYGSNHYGAALDRDAIRNPSGDGGARNQRWLVDSQVPYEVRALYSQKKDDYYHSEIERYFDDGRRESGNELNRTPRKQMQKKSALLRIETPRPSQRGRENDRSRHPCYYNEKRPSSFRGKEQLGNSDRGSVEKQRGGTPMELDVSFKSNVLVAKAIVTPTSEGMGSGVCVTPRSSKVRRVLVTDKDDKASFSEGIAKGDIKTRVTDKGSGSDKGFGQSKSEVAVSGVENKSDSHSNPSSNVSEDKMERDKSVEDVVSDCGVKVTDEDLETSLDLAAAKAADSSINFGEKDRSNRLSNPSSNVSEDKMRKDKSVEDVFSDCRLKITDKDLETSLDQAAAKADSSINYAEKVHSLVDEASKESKDEADDEHISNPKLCSAGEKVLDGDISVQKSHEDAVLDKKGTGFSAGEILRPKVMKKNRNMKKIIIKVKKFPPSLPVSQSAAYEKPSKCSEDGEPFAGMSSICSVRSQPCTNELSKNDKKDVSSTHLLVKETNVGLEGSNTDTSSFGSSAHGEKEFDKPSTEAAFLSCSEDLTDQLLTKSTMPNTCSVEDGSRGIHQKRDSLFPANDSSGDCPKDLFSSAGNVKSGTSVLEVNCATEHLANADYLTVETNTCTRFDSLDSTIAFGTERLNFACSQACENGVSPSVESGGMKRSLGSRPYGNAEETDDNSGSGAGKRACVNDVFSSPKNVARKGSLYVLPQRRSDGDLRNICKNREELSCELDLHKALSSEMCVEVVTTDNSVHNQDLNLKSHRSAESGVACLDPFTDGVSVLDGGSKACFTESKVSPSKDIDVGPGEALVERDVMERVPSSCNKFPGSQALVIDNSLATGGIGKSGSETISDSKCYSPGIRPFSEGCKVLLENRFGCGSSDAVGSVRDSSMDDALVADTSRVSSCLVPDNSVSQCRLSSLVPVNEQIRNATSVQANCGESQDDTTDKEIGRIGKLDIDSQKEKMKLSGETSKCRSPEIDASTITADTVIPCDSFSRPPQLSIGQMQNETSVVASGNETMNTQASVKEDLLLGAPLEQFMTSHEAVRTGSSLEHLPCSGQTASCTDVESDETPVSNYFALAGYPVLGSSEKPNDDLMETTPDVPSDVGSPESSPNIADTDTLDGEAPRVTTSDEKVSGTGCLVSSDAPFSTSHLHADVKRALGHSKDRLASVAALDSNNKTKALNSVGKKPQGRKNTFNHAGHKSYSPSFLFAAKRNVNPPTRIAKPHTWRREGDTCAAPLAAIKPFSSAFSAQQKLPKTTVDVKSTYIRRGNSLLRKSSHSATDGISLGLHPSDQSNCSAVGDKTLVSDRRTDGNDTSIFGRTGEIHTPDRLSVPPSDSITKVSSSIATSSGKHALSPGRDSLTNGFPESNTDLVTSGEADVPLSGEDGMKTSESENQMGYASDCQKETHANLASSNPLKIIYVKRKSNQLIAASDIQNASKNRIPPSDGYFKRRKNQLVRTSNSHVKLAVPSPDDASNAKAQAAPKNISKRKFTSMFSDIAVMKPFKRSKLSLVWTLNDTQSRKTNRVHMQYQNILPQLVPWKRVTYWRRLRNSVSVLGKSSFSSISRKLLLLRKRHTVYTRSTNGYSLRKSKVLSIGGSHLKWSKSIEGDSKKANEEATLAVAAFAKRKSENHSALGINGTKSRNHPSRERIFRIGSVRYKMDPSRRTLQRISDDESPYSGPAESEKDAKKSFIPKRLVIGNDEYVRVGNGNQLVRDPKQRTRVLANEKVRWSLHNARLRLAKKKKYCQFFTRFGKCNKDDGKCPYIHDPSKIAVCTKFLNGLCANPNCKLTHKVIPERMPDCSYFLQGLCNNEACPYRHVHVNQNAATCEGFLRGYCADGNECRKKHTYTCPVFEATGTCPHGSNCKLHHPKKRSKGKKRKRPCEPLQKNARGRYFGSLRNSIPESEPVLLDGHATESALFGGQAFDFISLDVSEDEAGESNDPATEQSVSGESDASDLLYERIKPVRLMQENATA